MKLNKLKENKALIIYLFLFATISIISIYSASNFTSDKNIYLKQILWYISGFIIIYLITKIKNKIIYDSYLYLYIFGNILLLLLLFFATPINNSKCWFNIFGIISFQPSEFMKIILIIMNAKIINEHKNKDFSLILKVFIITLIPSILTFLEPDTGVVIIYFIISLTMLFSSNINTKWFIYFIVIITVFLSSFLILYFYYDNTFIKIFGTSFFYRIDRLLDWKNGVGMQLNNAMSSIGSGGLFGHGFNNTPVYFPEAETDFIFSIFASNFGFLGTLILIIIIIKFDNLIINIGKKCKNNIDKYTIFGITGMIIFQQIQNISMNIGLLPITGITLPFISYGGSSLISYMIILGIIFNINNKN